MARDSSVAAERRTGNSNVDLLLDSASTIHVATARTGLHNILQVEIDIDGMGNKEVRM